MKGGFGDLKTLNTNIAKIRDKNNNWSSIPALKGESAYELAVKKGFEGSEDDFYNSLVKKEEIDKINETLKEDLSNKITKFYASNQGETHLADSDNGKIEDMVLYGKSEQKQYKGINLLKYPYTEATETSSGVMFTDNKDGSIGVNGTATGAAYYNLYPNIDGKRLTLASGTYKLVVKGDRKSVV